MKLRNFSLIILVIFFLTLNIQVYDVEAKPSVQLQTAINSTVLNPMKTGYLAMDNKVQEILLNCGYGYNDTYTVVKNCYNYLVNNYYYERISIYPYDDYVPGTPSLIQNWRYDAYAPLFLGKGDCYNYAYAFAILTRAIGLRSYVVGDKEDFGSTHHWTQIDINGTLYDFDVQAEGAKTKRGNIQYIYFGNSGKKNSFYKKPASKIEDILPENSIKIYSPTDFENYLTSKTYTDFKECDCHVYTNYKFPDGSSSGVFEKIKRLHADKLYMLAPYSIDELEQMAQKKFNKVFSIKELPSELVKVFIPEYEYNSYINDTKKEWKMALKVYLNVDNDYEMDGTEYIDIWLYNGGIFSKEIAVENGSLLIAEYLEPLICGYLGMPERILLERIENSFSDGYLLRDYAFFNCKSLKSAKLPVESLNVNNPFFNCINLESIYFDGDIRDITDTFLYFTNCKKLKTIIFNGKVENYHSFYGKTIATHSTDVTVYSKFSIDHLGIFCSFPKEIIPIVDMYINDKLIDFDQPSIITNGRTLAPARAIFEALGMNVIWDEATKVVTASNSENIAALIIGSNDVWVNYDKLISDVPAQIINGRTMIPVRIIAEAFGFQVDFDIENKSVYLKK